jgi:hypothetical protein
MNSRWDVFTGADRRKVALRMVGATALLVVGIFQHAWGVVTLAAVLLVLIPAMTLFRSRSNLSNASSATVPQRLIGTSPTWGLFLLATVFLVYRTLGEAGEGNVANAIFGAVGALCGGFLFVSAIVLAIKGKLPMA